jgi:hypothetical protein
MAWFHLFSSKSGSQTVYSAELKADTRPTLPSAMEDYDPAYAFVCFVLRTSSDANVLMLMHWLLTQSMLMHCVLMQSEWQWSSCSLLVWTGAVEAADPDSDQNIMTDAQLDRSEAITDSDFELHNGELLAIWHAD